MSSARRQYGQGKVKLLLIGAVVAGGGHAVMQFMEDEPDGMDEKQQMLRVAYRTIDECRADWNQADDCEQLAAPENGRDSTTSEVRTATGVAKAANGAATIADAATGHAGGHSTFLFWGPWFNARGTAFHPNGNVTQHGSGFMPRNPISSRVENRSAASLYAGATGHYARGALNFASTRATMAAVSRGGFGSSARSGGG